MKTSLIIFHYSRVFVICVIRFFLKPVASINKPTVILDGGQMTNTGWYHADM